ncbi:hypothetical protein BKA63DRAFT_418746 [Paraphoma chrysanthemicola]|nr:hypothetical protein BKA63DRAFT_418746 [Paraphoma chrysanthemicola]
MLPTAGLFLPETLHRQDRPASGHSESDSARLKYFQRMPGCGKEATRQKQVHAGSSGSLGGTETVNNFASITTALKFANFVTASSKASAESQTLAFLIHRVQHDLTEASRLYLSPAVRNFLEAWPDRKSWIDIILVDVRRALNDIGSYMDTFRVAGDDGGANGLKRKFEWISGHQKRLQSKQQLLSSCHQSLVTTINIMQTVELCGVTNGTWQDPIFEAPVQPWVKNDNAQALRGPYSRREHRISHKNLSLSSVQFPTSSRTRNTYRRSSSRRTYFNSTVDDSAAYHPTEETPDAVASKNQAAARSSFDHMPRPYRTASGQARTSLDNARPSSHPERLQTISGPGMGPRTSIDVLQPLPTLDEKTVERNDSTTSTSGVVAVSQVGKRYSPTPVFIRRHVGRHRSLPSELPHVQSQSSLTEDLADWADWMLPAGVQSEQLQSTEWDAQSDLQSPSMSVVSCPAVTQAMTSTPTLAADIQLPDSPFQTDEAPMRSADSEYQTDTRGNSTATSLPNMITVAQQRERAASIRSTASNIPRKPLPTTSTISMDSLSTPPQQINDTQAPSSEHKQNQQPEQPSTPANASKPFSHNSPETNIPAMSRETSSVAITDAYGTATISKPMTAQAKRRAAHQRRMEIAFGQAGAER